MRNRSFASLVCLPILLVHSGLAAQVATDLNIATGLDISASVGRDDEWLERVGTGRGIASQAFMEAVLSGRHGRVGVAVFAWSSHGCPLKVAWRVIETLEDAAVIARTLEATPLIDFEHDVGPPDHDQFIDTGLLHQKLSSGNDRLTDLSRAIECGRHLLSHTPFSATRSVLNIIGDGVDNLAEEPDAARDRAVAAGITVNGVVVNASPAVVGYYRNHVIGGHGAFVLDVADPATMIDVMTKKFLLDIASAALP
jgi:Ca-activated chloride channel homolog